MSSAIGHIIEQIQKSYKISDYLSERGFHPKNSDSHHKCYNCPLPSHPNDNTPSFYIYDKGSYEDYYCFGCIGENELVWTHKGLQPIKDISVGDTVISIFGDQSKVCDVSSKKKKVNKLRLASFKDPLDITDDHICLYLPKEEAIRCLPYINKRTDSEKTRLDYRYCSQSKVRSSYGDRVLLRASEFKHVKEGDFFVFPVIGSGKRNSKQLYCKEVARSRSKGPKIKQTKLKANTDLAFVYGLYLAKGSISGRTLRFTMHIDESDILEKVKSSIKQHLGLDSSLFLVPQKNTSELICSSIDLVDQMSYYFGKGCSNKQIPFETLYWREDIQEAMMQGYLTGDGNANKRSSISVSQKLTYGLYALAIQCGYLPVVSDRKISKQRDSSSRKDAWIITYRKTEGLNAFYEFIGDQKYFFSRVDSIEKQDGLVSVYDIGVEKFDSFVTKLGLVHNCKSGGSIVNFVSAFENISIRRAVDKLSNGIGIQTQDVMDLLVAEFGKLSFGEESHSKTEGLEFAFCLNKYLNDYLKAVNFNPEDLHIAETVGKVIEKYLYGENVEKLKEMMGTDGDDPLRDRIYKRVQLFNSRQAQIERSMLLGEDKYDNPSQKIVSSNDGTDGLFD